MDRITVKAYLVDGSLMEFTEGPAFLGKLQSLQTQGYTGKQLIHRLITDDWAAPPSVIEISGLSSDGKKVDVRIPYA